MGIISAIKNFVTKFKRAPATNKRAYYFGTIVKGSYSNARKDPNPLVLILYSGIQQTKLRGPVHMTHGINLNAIPAFEKNKLFMAIVSLSKSTIPLNPITFYDYLKINLPATVKSAYRTYFTAYLNSNIVSPGFFRAPVPVFPIRDGWIMALNKELFGRDIVRENAVRGEDNINEIIRRTTSKSYRDAPGYGRTDENGEVNNNE